MPCLQFELFGTLALIKTPVTFFPQASFAGCGGAYKGATVRSPFGLTSTLTLPLWFGHIPFSISRPAACAVRQVNRFIGYRRAKAARCLEAIRHTVQARMRGRFLAARCCWAEFQKQDVSGVAWNSYKSHREHRKTAKFDVSQLISSFYVKRH